MAPDVTDAIAANSYSNYIIRSNLTNAFAIGNIGEADDFWMVGSPPVETDAYPIITGNFLDGDGNPLFRLVRNVLTLNPKGCTKILGNQIGYEIRDHEGETVLKVETTARTRGVSPMLATILSGTFYNQQRECVAWTDEDGQLFIGASYAMGYQGDWATNKGLTAEQLEIAIFVAASGGAIHEMVTGRFENQRIILDGKAFRGATLNNCELVLTAGDVAFNTGDISNCTIFLEGQASRIHAILSAITRPGMPPQ